MEYMASKADPDGKLDVDKSRCDSGLVESLGEPQEPASKVKVEEVEEDQFDSSYGSSCLSDRLDSSYGTSSITDSLSEALDKSCRIRHEDNKKGATESRDKTVTDSPLDPYTFLGEDGDTIVHLAAIHKAEACALHFISFFSVEVLEIQNDLFQAALHLCVYTNQSCLVRALVLRGVSLEQQDWHGNTPLHLACEYGLVQCVQALTQQPTAQERDNLQHLCLGPRHQDLELQNWQGVTCLHVATLGRNQEIMEHLLQNGANVDAQDGTSGKTALHLAVELHEAALVSLLLRHNADVDAVMYNGCTALHLAVGRQDTGIASALCQAGADTFLPNVEEETPQDLAAGNVDILALFPFDDVKLGGQPVLCADF
ncbi:NF-kappa-B inhibitor epsilon [Callorhinchus milii]|uniref:Nuclear factor of kappa light polypeptide gene enhancer in B-cells inhibitor, epsilon n=1 Tax=Callorhinchus milii TaxID=7868 RepID=A0A4W3JPG4_CALMI|nr:NF-kappa-B inhibitor epsilon [Callorhinchus milii]|eukprot:gi/632960795/ref/XP_007896402.1/ PREDICTED: NF-kappa-B inhibitor epsilon [Callorhinchus milii]